MPSVPRSPSRITPTQWTAQAWRNGRGVTREIVRWPDGDGAYDVRVSLAEVTASGPFSTFPGYERWTTLVDGGPVTLIEAEATPAAGPTPLGAGVHVLAACVPRVLPGDVALVAQVDAPAMLLNVIARPGLVEVGFGTPAAPVDFVLAIAETEALPRWHARVLVPPARVDGDVLWIGWRG